MRNHYHLALETLRANLVEGMHWFQSIVLYKLAEQDDAVQPVSPRTRSFVSAQDRAHLALAPGLERVQSRELKEAAWLRRLEEALARQGKRHDELRTRPMNLPWKLELARQLRELGASTVWIAEHLCLGRPGSVRSYFCRGRGNQRTTA